MVGSKMSKTEYDLKAYPAYDTPHKLCNIRGNQNIQQPRLPPNNAGRPMSVHSRESEWQNIIDKTHIWQLCLVIISEDILKTK